MPLTDAPHPRPTRGTLPSLAEPPPQPPIPFATALRASLKSYDKLKLRQDVLAGLVVGVVALPLSMALAIAVGVPPQHGLYTAVAAGIIAMVGGCRYQVSGPTAAFIVILAPIAQKHGVGGLLTAGLLSGFILIAMGIARLGRLIQFIPHPVTTGFTSGIGVVIATLQIKDVLGLSVPQMGDHFQEKAVALWHARGSFQITELAIAALTFALLLVVPRLERRVPAPLVALGFAALLTAGLHAIFPTLEWDTLGSRFTTVIDGQVVHGIPRALPTPGLPWGETKLTLELIQDLVPSAFAIAMLGAIESLLSAVIADGLTGTRHDPDSELVGQGVGNVVAPLFGGIAATGALARTATNIRAGAVSPIAAVVHSVVVLASIVVLAPLVAYVPMASLAALLLLVAWNMSELHQFVRILRIAPKSDASVLLLCFGLTIFFDMVVAIAVGVVLASLLFMRRMAEIAGARVLVAGEDAASAENLPSGVALYEINGPLFFGAAKSAMGAITAITDEHPRAVIIHLGLVPAMDATGLVALDAAIGTVMRHKIAVVLAGPIPKPERMFERAGLTKKYPELRIAPTLKSAIAMAAAIEPPPASKKGG